MTTPTPNTQTDDVWSHHAPKDITEAESVETLAADLAGVPRDVSSEDATQLADALHRDWKNDSPDYDNMVDAAVMLRTLVSERDALAGRVAELEAERDRLTLSRADRECLRIGQELQRAAGELPDGYEIEIEVERGAGSVYLSNPDYSKVGFHDMVDGMSYAITGAIDAALASKEQP